MKNKKTLTKNLVYGGLFEISKENLEIRKLQIKSNNFLHTCADYGLSIELIAEASKSIGLKPKIITKIFYKYPNFRSERYKPLYAQLEEISYRLGFLPDEWIIQLSCCKSPLNLVNNEIDYFFKKIKKDFGISKILLEYYPVYDYSFKFCKSF